MLLALGTLATCLYRLADLPAGLLQAEAAHGLLARAATEDGPSLLNAAGDYSLVLSASIALAGRPLGFDIEAVRLGAALAATGTVILTSLWLRHVFGPGWGLVGGLIVAGSFWPLLFGRLALSPIAGAMMLAALLACLWEAIGRDGRTGNRWYVAAGVVAWLGFVADPALRILPLLLFVACAVQVWNLRRLTGRWWASPPPLWRTLAVFAILLSVSLDPNETAHLWFWSPTPGLATSTVGNLANAMRGYGAALWRLVWFGSESRELNLPADPLFNLAIVAWAMPGLIVALRRIREPVIMAGLLWGALLLVPAAVLEPVHPGRLLPTMPLLVALPVAGMYATVRTVQHTAMAPLVVPVLIILTVGGNLIWSSWHYFANWAEEQSTVAVMNADVVDALSAIDTLPATDMILFSTYDQPEILSYLQPEPSRRQDFDGREALPIPLKQDGYLVMPQTTAVDPALLLVFERVEPQQAGGVSIYRIDDRAREALPLSVPTTSFGQQLRFLGHVLEPRRQELAVVVAFSLPGGGSAHRLSVQLRPVESAEPAQEVEVILPGELLNGPHVLLRLVSLEAPAPGTAADLLIRLQDAQGNLLSSSGLDPQGYLFLNRYTFSNSS